MHGQHQLVFQIFTFEFKPRSELIHGEPNRWISDLAKVEMKNGRGASGLDFLAARFGGHCPFLGQRTRAHIHHRVPVGQGR